MTATNVTAFPVRYRKKWIESKLKQAANFPKRRDIWLEAQIRKYNQHLIEIGVDDREIERDIDYLWAAFFGADQAIGPDGGKVRA